MTMTIVSLSDSLTVILVWIIIQEYENGKRQHREKYQEKYFIFENRDEKE